MKRRKPWLLTVQCCRQWPIRMWLRLLAWPASPSSSPRLHRNRLVALGRACAATFVYARARERVGEGAPHPHVQGCGSKTASAFYTIVHQSATQPLVAFASCVLSLVLSPSLLTHPSLFFSGILSLFICLSFFLFFCYFKCQSVDMSLHTRVGGRARARARTNAEREAPGSVRERSSHSADSFERARRRAL